MIVGVVGIVVYAEMAGRVAAISGRPVFDVVRERLGARAALLNLGASFFINLLTLTAEIAGLAIVLQLAASTALVFHPRGITAEQLSQVTLPVGAALWRRTGRPAFPSRGSG